MEKTFFIFTFILILIIAILHELALNFFLYWKFWWFDILMHFLGGLWIGLISLWFYFLSGYVKYTKKRITFIFVLSSVSVLVVGIAWELFELLVEFDFSSEYLFDTISDLILDILGALTASIILINIDRKEIL